VAKNRKDMNVTLEVRKLNQVEDSVYLGSKINENRTTYKRESGWLLMQ